MMDAADAKARVELIVNAAMARRVADVARPTETPPVQPTPAPNQETPAKRPKALMSRAARETSVPSKMSREQLEALVVGLVDHRIATVEERLAALERRTTVMLSSCDGGTATETPEGL
jgi:hypothetical protein